MKINQIQQALKNAGITTTQAKISEVLEAISIDPSAVTESQLPELVKRFQDYVHSSGIVLSNGKSKATLGLPAPAQNVQLGQSRVELGETDTTAHRQSNANQTMGDKLIQTANAIAENNVEMAKALPGVVRDMTFAKLQENAATIQSNWDAATDEMTQAMFGL
jgi:hypothetical protein